MNSYKPRTAAQLKALKPEKAVQMLKDGNERFVKTKQPVQPYGKQIKGTSTSQYPIAAILCCIDSRVPAEVIFDQGIGDIFVARVAGNFSNTDILGSLEYACGVVGSKAIVVLGHTGCGAVKSAIMVAESEETPALPENIPALLSNILPAVEGVTDVEGKRNAENAKFVQRVADENVRLTIANIKANSKTLRNLYHNKKIAIVGAMYDVSTGKVIWPDEEEKKWL